MKSISIVTKVIGLIASLVMVALVAAADYYAGWHISLSIFYLLPIFVCVHNVGRWPSLALALACGVTALFVEMNENPLYYLNENDRYFRHPIIGYWNGLAMTGVFLIFAVLMASVEAALHREKRINQNLETLLTLSPSDSRGWLAPASEEEVPAPRPGAGEPQQPV